MNITMQALSDLGFKIIRSYPYDHFITQIWQRGNLTIERTFDTSKHYTIESEEVIIGNISFKLKNFKELVILDEILNR